MSESGITWVASYPKSGNTWIRCLIASLQAGGAAPRMASLGRFCPNGAARNWLEEILDIPTEDMVPPELAVFRADVYRHLAQSGGETRFVKVHDAYDPRLFPPEATARTVYAVRDPRDVAPSWALHMNVPLDGALDRMEKPDFTLARVNDRYNSQAEQCLTDWSGHVASWLDRAAAQGPLLLIRYEDLLADPITWVGRLAEFLGIAVGDGLIARTVSACRFEALRAAEENEGFSERPPVLERFFRQGRAGAWNEVLTPRQAARIVAAHGAMMRRLGYVSGE
ncbi:sulfotransferase domain-containing protein [Paramagnetospirillum magneticum]|uniref:Flavonol 3-sulfotransferase n=1 Tax=Paramagnetospirillum magneticum (strain ATCC 700264 / AMB-1) TaxID=342108 RepID=Q2W7B6_PARM1|nr:sulfotransferase domain-containing protein [Paramagnetospirillum magneticum]BAE50259.1 Flavonol 3-sulfotransferase [Paramagnetospirillum magneticum AMB-1]